MPIAQVFPRYHELLTELITNNFFISEAIKLKQQREWQRPKENTWDGDPHHLSGGSGLPGAFERGEINAAYVLALQTGGEPGGGRVTDTKSCKMQGDYIAADERATSLRYATPIRCAMMASARREGHAQATGVFATLVKNVADNLADGYLGA